MNDYDFVNQKSLRKAIYEEIKEEILCGKRLPGARLMELDLSKEKGASRTPIREAIKLLAEDGLVAIVPNKGAYVTKITLQELLEILEVREEIDGMSAYYAAQRIDDEILQELQTAMDEYKNALASEDKKEIVYWDAQFHKVIVKATKNRVLINLVGKLREEILRLRHLYYGDFRENHDTVKDHKDLFEAISNRNSELAKELAKKHMREIMASIEKAYE